MALTDDSGAGKGVKKVAKPAPLPKAPTMVDQAALDLQYSNVAASAPPGTTAQFNPTTGTVVAAAPPKAIRSFTPPPKAVRPLLTREKIQSIITPKKMPTPMASHGNFGQFEWGHRQPPLTDVAQAGLDQEFSSLANVPRYEDEGVIYDPVIGAPRIMPRDDAPAGSFGPNRTSNYYLGGMNQASYDSGAGRFIPARAPGVVPQWESNRQPYGPAFDAGVTEESYSLLNQGASFDSAPGGYVGWRPTNGPGVQPQWEGKEQYGPAFPGITPDDPAYPNQQNYQNWVDKAPYYSEEARGLFKGLPFLPGDASVAGGAGYWGRDPKHHPNGAITANRITDESMVHELGHAWFDQKLRPTGGEAGFLAALARLANETGPEFAWPAHLARQYLAMTKPGDDGGEWHGGLWSGVMGNIYQLPEYLWPYYAGMFDTSIPPEGTTFRTGSGYRDAPLAQGPLPPTSIGSRIPVPVVPRPANIPVPKPPGFSQSARSEMLPLPGYGLSATSGMGVK